jgi:hypothetical protein
MNNSVLAKRLAKGDVVYLYDDYEDAIVKFMFNKSDNRTQTWIKRKGRQEREIPQSEPIVLDILMGGKEVNKKFYDDY